MGLFYAFAKNCNDNETWRYVIVFASREVADEWWRAVSETSFLNSIVRVTPQFYTHDPTIIDISNSVTDPRGVPAYLNKVFFTLLQNRMWAGLNLDLIPNTSITDHVSGNLFFIRSQANPCEYWYCPGTNLSPTVTACTCHSQRPRSESSPNTGICTCHPGTSVYLSRTERSRFRISISDKSKGTIMIGSDSITITEISRGLSIAISDYGVVTAGQGVVEQLKFKDFKGGFRATTTMEAGNEQMKEVLKREDGEDWELV